VPPGNVGGKGDSSGKDSYAQAQAMGMTQAQAQAQSQMKGGFGKYGYDAQTQAGPAPGYPLGAGINFKGKAMQAGMGDVGG